MGLNMELWLVWVILGFVLVIAELITGTFYLLVVALGAFVAAVVAWLGGNTLVQAVLGSAVALAGTWYVHHYHEAKRNREGGKSNLLDRGQPVVLEGWANESAGLARVRYRGTSWDARLAAAEARPAPGTTLYIDSQEGNTLVLVAAPPAH